MTFAEPPILADADTSDQAEAGLYDLVIYDRCQPTRMPQANTLFLGSLPPGDAWKAGPSSGPPTIIDIDRVHPLTQLVDMNYVRIAEGRPLKPPPGSTVLFDSVIGPLLAIGPREGFEDAVCGFPLFVDENGEIVPNTTWPLRPSFPVFVYNAVRYLGGSRGALAITSVAPGSPITLRSPARITEITVVESTRRTQRLRAIRSKPLCLHANATNSVCTSYSRAPTSRSAQRFAVNLFDLRESDLRPRASLELGHETVPGQPVFQSTRRELWKWILVVGADRAGCRMVRLQPARLHLADGASSAAALECGDDPIDIEHASAPGAASQPLQGGPQPGLVGQVGIGTQIGMGCPLRQQTGSFVGRHLTGRCSHHVHASRQLQAVHLDPNPITVAHLGKRSAGQRFGPDVPDARSRADAGEPRVGHNCDVASPFDILQRRGELIGLFHPAPQWSAAHQNHDISGLHRGA